MKTSFNGNAQRKLVTVLAGGAALMLISNFAAASIADTRHNLSTSNTIVDVGRTPNKFTGTGEICVFCHTPHGADASASVPIWNRTLSAATSYTRYSNLGTSSFDAAEAPIGSVSIACLSCHDGTQAMNVMINTPGSGTSGSISGIWSGSNVSAGATGYMTSQLANTNTTGPGEFPRLGQDLQNDHPISMQYGGGGIVAGESGNQTTDPDFAQPSGDSAPDARIGATIGQVGQRTLGNNKVVWWVETGASAGGGSGYDKYDLNLYTRSDATGGTLGTYEPFVECASCHDPHSNNTTFLRRNDTNVGSATCLTCHNK